MTKRQKPKNITFTCQNLILGATLVQKHLPRTNVFLALFDQKNDLFHPKSQNTQNTQKMAKTPKHTNNTLELRY